MSTCGTTIPAPSTTTGTELEVIKKFKELMVASLSDDSIYNKSKETFAHIFKDLQITEIQRAEFVAQNISSMTTAITNASMSTALQWASEEVNNGAKLALLKSQAHAESAKVKLIEEQICNLEKDTCVKTATAISLTSKSIRENGEVDTSDGCIVTSLKDGGESFEKIKQLNATTYSILAKTYREYGEVHVHYESNTDAIDGEGFLKGYPDNEASRTNGYGWGSDLDYGDCLVTGYRNVQMLVAERQRVGFEDNKNQHAANSSAQMVSQLLGSADIVDLSSSDVAKYMGYWTNSMSYLTNRGSCTPSCAPASN